MRTLDRIVPDGAPDTSVTLPLAMRVRSRLRVRLVVGTEAGVLLDRGQVLRDGDLLGGPDGLIVRVRAKSEPLSCVGCDDSVLLARICYHLGNRHVAVQIVAGEVRYQHDHVLDDMVRGLGARPELRRAPFDPEPGAYGGHGHRRSGKEHGH